MLMVAAGDARYEVFHYLFNSLIDAPSERITRGQQPLAVGGYDTDSGLSDEGVVQGMRGVDRCEWVSVYKWV